MTGPVIDVAGKAGCVRLDRHAVFLGLPKTSTCPAHIVGQVATVHITPGLTSVSVKHQRNAQGAVYDTSTSAMRTMTVFPSTSTHAGVVITAGAESEVQEEIARSVRVTAAGAGPLSSAPEALDPRVSLSPLATTATGMGFDTCAAPSVAAMRAWLSSPYRSANIYIGGADRGCAQANLTAGWVTSVVSQGWKLIPTYVGLQAPCWPAPGSKIDPGNAAAQGVASADDAINQMTSLGLGAGSPVYFDVEQYNTGDAGCVGAVETFLDSWTQELHAKGYASGIYSSASSGITNMVQETHNPSYHLPDDIWFAHWNGVNSVYGDAYVPDSLWNNHQRIHQFAGGHDESYSGVKLNIDSNAVDGAVAPATGDQPPSPQFNLLSNASFEVGNPSPWQKCNIPDAVNLTTYTKPGYAREGTSYAEMNTSAQGGSVCQDVGIAPRPGQSHTFSVWLRTPPGTPRVSGTLTLWATGGTGESDDTNFTVGDNWTLVSVPLDITTANHSGLRAEIYLATTNANLDADGASLAAGNGQDSGLVDPPAAPPIRPSSVPRFTTRSTSVVSWARPASQSPIATYEVRWRRAAFNQGLSGWNTPAAWRALRANSLRLTLRAGDEACLQVRATDSAGRVSSWSASRCTARALDDRALRAARGWTRRTGRGYYAGTYTTSSRRGMVLTAAAVHASRIVVIATRCRGCGEIAAYAGSVRLGTINLDATMTRRQQQIVLPAFSYRNTNITIRTLTSKTVQIDGLVTTHT